MKKRVIILGIAMVVCLSLLACGSTLKQSRTANFEVNKKEYTTYIKADDGPFGCILNLYVNDQQIASGTITMLTPQTVLSGQYNGIKFDAECGASKTGGINMVQRCKIYAKGQQIAEVQY